MPIPGNCGQYNGDGHQPAGPYLTFYHNDFISSRASVNLGGGATERAVFAYNRFNVGASFAAVIKKGSDGTIFHGNQFAVRDPDRRGENWTYSHPRPRDFTAAIFFPQGAPAGVRFTDNTFHVPFELPIFAPEQPAVARNNELVVDLPQPPGSAPAGSVPLAGEWRVKVVTSLEGPRKRHRDPGLSNEAERLLAADVDHSDWPSITMPSRPSGPVLDWNTTNGEAVFRREFDVPAKFTNRELTLSLGQIDDRDQVWINGKKVGEGHSYSEFRRYTVPAGLLRESGNVIAIRIWDEGGAGGMAGSKGEVWLGVASDEPASEPPHQVDIPMPDPPVPSLYEWQMQQLQRQ